MVEQSVWSPFPSQAASTGGCSQWSLSSLSLPAQLETVLPEPGSPPRASLSLVELVSLTKPTRLLASSSQAALLEPPLVWLNLCPLPSPRDFLPAAVRPLSSLCFWTAAHIQLILGSLLIAEWWVSIMMTSKYL